MSLRKYAAWFVNVCASVIWRAKIWFLKSLKINEGLKSYRIGEGRWPRLWPSYHTKRFPNATHFIVYPSTWLHKKVISDLSNHRVLPLLQFALFYKFVTTTPFLTKTLNKIANSISYRQRMLSWSHSNETYRCRSPFSTALLLTILDCNLQSLNDKLPKTI